MKMMSSTNITSTNGVTLIPVISSSLSLAPPAMRLDSLVMRQNQTHHCFGIGDLALHHPVERIVGNDCRDRHHEADRGRDERFRDTCHHDGRAAGGIGG